MFGKVFLILGISLKILIGWKKSLGNMKMTTSYLIVLVCRVLAKWNYFKQAISPATIPPLKNVEQVKVFSLESNCLLYASIVLKLHHVIVWSLACVYNWSNRLQVLFSAYLAGWNKVESIEFNLVPSWVSRFSLYLHKFTFYLNKGPAVFPTQTT